MIADPTIAAIVAHIAMWINTPSWMRDFLGCVLVAVAACIYVALFNRPAQDR